MKEIRYKLDKYRVITLWFAPFLYASLILLLFYPKFSNAESWSVHSVIGLIVFFSIGVGVFILLFFNHLPLARKTEIRISGGALDKKINIRQGGQMLEFDRSEIEKIIEYSERRIPWDAITRWDITVSGTSVIITSLTISRLDFERHFHDKTEHKSSFFPWI